MPAANAIDVHLVGQVVAVETQREVLIERVGHGCTEQPVARNHKGVEGVAVNRVLILQPTADGQIERQRVGCPNVAADSGVSAKS